MTIEFSCPSCQSQYRVDDSRAGASAECKKCGNAMQIPAAAASADAPTCPVCTKPLTPGAEICFACGYEFPPQDADPNAGTAVPSEVPYEPTEDDERDPDEPLQVKARESAGVRVGAQVARWITVVGSVVVIGLACWWAVGAFSASRAQGKIQTLVDTIVAGKASPPEAARELAEQLPYLPDYLTSLSKRIDGDMTSNPNFGEFQYEQVDKIAHCKISFGGRVLAVDSEFADTIPRPFKEAAAISTLIVNLPSDCDTTPIDDAQDTVGQAAMAKRRAMQAVQK